MPVLNDAASIKVGSDSVTRVYLGSNEVWDELRALIASRFGNGEQGAMFIPQPVVLGKQALFQDDAGTTPVEADGDPVGLMLDLSPNGNDASQSTSAARPIYRTDGVVHWLQLDRAAGTHLLIADSPGMRQSEMSWVWSASTVSSERQDIVSNGDTHDFDTNNWLMQLNSGDVNVLGKSIIRIGDYLVGNEHVISARSTGSRIEGQVNRSGIIGGDDTVGTASGFGTAIGASIRSSITHFLDGRIYGGMILGGEAIDDIRLKSTEDYFAKLSGLNL